ncbi:hypothetical protein RJ45_08760 [Photobacterium gaetbulicola]|uniref:Carrier domain-containing protein n=1 Tax=Photobacterium gaetbulicola TaxID=1295392 RepID=A0A0B9G5T9_9GAMM|nr:non-ribosomal peptide synthetase [Photobacterium gaetbulicola]KHT63994.1 hypothetical protein RJ45_08760 [Photobacterium gaetbulicola]
MTLTELLRQCAEKGLRLTLVNGNVKVNAPKGALTPDIVKLLREHKDILKQELEIRFAASTTDTAAGQQRDVLSFNQHRLWFIDHLGGGSNYLNLPASFLLEGPCDVEALTMALRQVVERHEVLRTVYRIENGEPKPHLLPSENLPVPVTDLSDHDDYKAQVLALIDADSDVPFSLADDYMLRCHIYRIKADEHVLQLNMHHIASDGWSQRVLMNDLSALYQDYSEARSPTLPPMVRQYADFAAWQRGYLTGPTLQAHLDYWQGALEGAPTTHSVPLDTPRTADKTYPGAVHHVQLDKLLSEQLYQLARDNGMTLFMVLETAFAVLVGRLGNCRDVVLGSPISNRNQAEYTDVIGFFVNTLVLRTQWEEGESFRQILANSKAHLLDAYEYQSVPYELLLDSLKVERNLSHNALFQIMFVLQEKLDQQGSFPGLDIQMLPQKRGTSQFEIILTAVEQDEGLGLSWRYDTELFSAETIASFASALAHLLAEVAQHPDQAVDALPLLSFESLNGLALPGEAQSEVAATENICSAIDRCSAAHPDHIAVVCGEEVLTYHQLSEKSNQLAHRLAELGIGKGQVVAISLPRSLEMSIAMLAVLRLGAAYLPIDTRFPAGRRQFMVEDSGAVALITNDKTEKTTVPVLSASAGSDITGVEWLAVAVDSDDLAYINYTSGTTGKPKGVMVSHGNLANYCRAAQQHYHIEAIDRVMQASAFSFDACIEEHFMAFVYGATLVYRDDICLADWQHFTRFIQHFGVTVAGLPTAVWNGFCDDERSLRHDRPGDLRLLILGGEAMKAERLGRWKEAIGEQVQVLNTYGPTETTIITTAYDTANWQPGSAVPIGRIIDGARGYIVDQHNNLLPQGAVGELCIGGMGVARGYLNRPDEAVFGELEIARGVTERVYRTGDLVRLAADGELTYIGRKDHQLKIRGYRIEPEEIEAQLCKHPEVSQAVVIAHQTAQEQTVLVAFATLSDVHRSETSETELRAFLQHQLPDYMVPAQIMIIDAIPLTVNGKLDKQRLPAVALESVSQAEFVAAETEVERTLSSIWQTLLKLDKVSVQANFFELGGHSLLGIKLIAALKEQFDITLTIRELFEAQTVRKLAALIAERDGSESSPAQPVAGNVIRLEKEASALDYPQWLPTPEAIASQCQDLRLQLKSGNVRGILLTGATGYIGAFLLDYLLRQHPEATVYCLVRASLPVDGQARIKANLEQYGIWHDSYGTKIRAVPADLSLPDLGLDAANWAELATSTQWIIHNGAMVNHVLPYQALKAANVDGTEALLRLSTDQQVKLLSYISATAVFGGTESSRTITESTSIDWERHPLDAGYAGSKWVAEKMVMKAREFGLPCHIFRLGRIGPHSQTAVGTGDDLPGRYMRTCLALGCYPDSETLEWMAPVDIVCQAIGRLSLAEIAQPGNFHLVGKYESGWNAILASAGIPLQACSHEQWLDLIEESLVKEQPLPMAPYVLMLKQMVQWRKQDPAEVVTQRFCQKSTEGMMAQLGIHYPEPNKDFYAAYMRQLGA